MKRLLTFVVLGFFLYSLCPDVPAEARRGFGGGFGRSSFGRGFGRSGWGRGIARRSYGSRRSFSSWGRSSRRSVSQAPPFRGAKPSGWTGGNMARRVGTHGRVFNSRGQAQSAYRKNLKSRWNREPAARPAYVPRTFRASGRNNNVVFHNGGYGYWGPGRVWVALAASNMLMTGSMMASHGYYYGSPYYMAPHGGGFSMFFILVIIFLFVSMVGRQARGMY